jgi:hypothetical protein
MNDTPKKTDQNNIKPEPATLNLNELIYAVLQQNPDRITFGTPRESTEVSLTRSEDSAKEDC